MAAPADALRRFFEWHRKHASRVLVIASRDASGALLRWQKAPLDPFRRDSHVRAFRRQNPAGTVRLERAELDTRPHVRELPVAPESKPP